MKKIYYEKIGRKYVPVAEYDSEYLDSFPKGSHLVMVYPGGQSRRFNIDPNYAAMIAAGRIAEEKISSALVKASESRPPRKALTEKEREAWLNLINVWGEEARSLTRPSARDIAEAGVTAMIEEAEKLLTNPATKKAFDHFIMVAKLCDSGNDQNEK